MLRSLLAKVLPLVLLLVPVTWIGLKLSGFGLRHSSDTSGIDKGNEAQASHLLRGRRWIAKAREARRHARAAPPYEEAQEAGQMLLGGAGLAGQPAAVRAAIWLSAWLVQRPVAVPSAERKALHRALTEFAQVRDDGATGVEASLSAARCLVALGQRPLAVAGLEALTRRHPDEMEAHRRLAALFIDLNAVNPAIRHLRAWGKLDPQDGRPYRWIGFFHKEYGNPQENASNTLEAIKAYEEALRRHLEAGDRADVVEELAEILIDTQGDSRKALEVLGQCPERFGDAPGIVTLRADCLGRLNRSSEAVRLLDGALRQYPQFPPALLLRATMYRDEEEPRKARPLLEKAVAVDPYNDKIRQQLALVYKELGDHAREAEQKRFYEEARAIQEDLANLTQAATEQPSDDGVRYRLALLFLKLKHTHEAAMWLQAAVAANPDNYQARQLLTGLSGGRGVSRRSSALGSE